MILSPVTKSNHIKLTEKIPVSIIEEKYKHDLNLDVSRFFKTEYVEIYECLDTGFRFYYPFDITGDEELYEILQKHPGYYSIWNWEHEMTLGLIQQNYRVLEVGCGTGNFLKMLKEKNIKATGLELNNEAVKVCIKNNLNVHNILLNEHILQYRNYYDVVCSFQVLEHVQNPKDYIAECIEATRSGGKIVFGVPNNNPYLFKRDKYHTLNLPPHHMGLWSVEAFNNLPKYFNIKKVSIETEELFAKQYYFDLIFDSHKTLAPLKRFKKYISAKALDRIAKIADWKGRNLVAVFEKL